MDHPAKIYIMSKHFCEENKRFDVIPIQYKPFIEKALEIKLHDWQCDYLFTEAVKCFPIGRKTGKTLTKLTFQILVFKKIPIKYNAIFIDEEHGENYKHWFKHEFLMIRNKLQSVGLPVCDIK